MRVLQKLLTLIQQACQMIIGVLFQVLRVLYVAFHDSLSASLGHQLGGFKLIPLVVVLSQPVIQIKDTLDQALDLREHAQSGVLGAQVYVDLGYLGYLLNDLGYFCIFFNPDRDSDGSIVHRAQDSIVDFLMI